MRHVFFSPRYFLRCVLYWKCGEQVKNNKSFLTATGNCLGCLSYRLQTWSGIERLSITFSLRQTANGICRTWPGSFTVHYFYAYISSFTQFPIHKNCFELFLSEKFSTWIWRLPYTWSLNSLMRKKWSLLQLGKLVAASGRTITILFQVKFEQGAVLHFR